MRPSETNRRANPVFTAAAIGAALLAGAHFSDALRPQAAGAQPDDEFKSPFNSTADRKAQTEQLKEMNARLGRIEAQLKTGINVKVIEMPKDKDKDADKPAKP